MDEVKRILQLLKESYDGYPWHGSSLKEILKGVTFETASARVLGSAHTIWENVHHIYGWMDISRRRLLGEIVEATPDQDWPPVKVVTAAAWEESLKKLEDSFTDLSKAISGLRPDALEKQVAGKDHDAATMLYGAVNHNIYHSGQIALLKKELTSRS